MKKHIETLEARRKYLVQKLAGDIALWPNEFMSVFRQEKDALDWALGKLTDSTELVMLMDPDTGEVLTERVDEISIGPTGHYGPVHEGDRVQAKSDVVWANIRKGEVGKVTLFDRWAGEEYPYHVSFEHGRLAAFAREEIRRVD